MASERLGRCQVSGTVAGAQPGQAERSLWCHPLPIGASPPDQLRRMPGVWLTARGDNVRQADPRPCGTVPHCLTENQISQQLGSLASLTIVQFPNSANPSWLIQVLLLKLRWAISRLKKCSLSHFLITIHSHLRARFWEHKCLVSFLPSPDDSS